VSIVDTIGSTPLVPLDRLVAAHGLSGRILAKLEYLNPGGSKKDRVALEMVRDAREAGELKPGQPVVELTSGNTGTGLALVCKAFGHPFVAVMSRGNTPERAAMMRALGAELVLVEQAPGGVVGKVSGADLALVEERARALVQERGAFRADQFTLPASALAHERHTGPEIWEQSEGAVDVFVDFVGSGGSFAGVTRALRARRPELRAYVVEPATAPALAGGAVIDPGHRVQGGGYSRSELALLEPSLVTGYLTVTDDDAVRWARAAAAEEGVLGGFSTGANVAAAVQLLAGPEQGATIAVLACDSAMKYLSTDLYG
jgi:cysteine synthase A